MYFSCISLFFNIISIKSIIIIIIIIIRVIIIFIIIIRVNIALKSDNGAKPSVV